MKKYNYLIIGAIIAVISFIISYFGTLFIIGKNISGSAGAYAIMSLILGTIGALFYLFKFKYAFYIFLIGIIIGYLGMLRSFSANLTGWGDLAGIITLLLSLSIGFGLGAVIQFFAWAFKKYKK